MQRKGKVHRYNLTGVLLPIHACYRQIYMCYCQVHRCALFIQALKETICWFLFVILAQAY